MTMPARPDWLVAVLHGGAVRCAGCGVVLAAYQRGRLVVRHKRREVVVDPPSACRSIRCDDCGVVTRPVFEVPD